VADLGDPAQVRSVIERALGQLGAVDILVNNAAVVTPPGPAGGVVVSVYSSGAIGRLTADDVVGMIRYLRDHASSAA
jgi:NAD(P)-dependent dehydrogenase (short-subunit alcohol dehydrogenase family)